MHSLLRSTAWTLLALAVCCALGVLIFDQLMVRPVVGRIEDRLGAASPGERQPPAAVMDLLRRAHGARTHHLVAREALLPDQLENMGTLRRRLTELGIALLLPAHLSDADIAGAYLAGAYMGPDVCGFAAASRLYLGIELDKVNLAQAARLVALAQAPNIYRQSPERLERRTRQLLSLPGQAG